MLIKSVLRFIILCGVFISLSVSCVEKNGYYEPGQEETISLLVDKTWEREYPVDLNGKKFMCHEFWRFSDNGKGSYKTISTYEDGKKEEIVTYFQWSFTTPNFKIIYMDYPKYWEIEKLTETELNICETNEDPITVLDQAKRYRKLTCK